ncbi:MAG: DUF2628 domain-containing protein, partial [Dokdonella sp.]|uniref:DUF2628 domain-containing protein n=1 Tax=Dokdonella sp. TaxID=2291710 RepID=UPI00326419FA
MHALVIIGRMPGSRDASDAAVQGAAILGLSEDAFATQVIAAAPVTARESPDADSLKLLQQRLTAGGIESNVVPSDGIAWQIELDGVSRGPVPLAWLESEVRAGRLDAGARVRRTSNPSWLPLTSVVSADPSHPIDPAATQPNPAVPPDMLEAARLFIGANHAFYLRSWGIEGSGGHAWNWPAFFLGPSWLLYRKMYGYAFAWLAFAVVESLIESRLDVSTVLSWAISIAVNVLIATAGNALYRKHFERAIRTLSPGRDLARLRVALVKDGGTNPAGAILWSVLFGLVLLAIQMVGVDFGMG